MAVPAGPPYDALRRLAGLAEGEPPTDWIWLNRLPEPVLVAAVSLIQRRLGTPDEAPDDLAAVRHLAHQISTIRASRFRSVDFEPECTADPSRETLP